MSRDVEISAVMLCESIRPEPFEARLGFDDDGITVDGEDLTIDIDLRDVFDVRVGPVPPAAADVFAGRTLTIGFDGDEEREILFVDWDDGTLDRVVGLLYRRLLNETEVAVRHPTKVGGRVTGETFDIGELRVGPDRFGCRGINMPVVVDLETVVDVSRSKEELLGERQSIIGVQYVRDGVAVSLDLSINPPRKQHLLGRFLRRDYDRIRRELKNVDVPAPALRALTRLYSLRGTAKPQSLLHGESAPAAAILRGLVDSDLVRTTDGRVELTSRGWILVNERVGASESATPDSDAEEGSRFPAR